MSGRLIRKETVIFSYISIIHHLTGSWCLNFDLAVEMLSICTHRTVHLAAIEFCCRQTILQAFYCLYVLTLLSSPHLVLRSAAVFVL